MNCPLCRRSTFIKSYDSDCLPRNQVVNSILRNFHNYSNETSYKCDLCKLESNLIKECIACCVNLCENCEASHKSNEKYSHHKILRKYDDEKLLCKEHIIIEDLFCLEDKIGLCKMCWEENRNHVGHKIVTKESATITLANEIIQTKKMLKTIEVRVNNTKNAIMEELREIENYDKSDGRLTILKESEQDDIGNQKRKLKIKKSCHEARLSVIEVIEK